PLRSLPSYFSSRPSDHLSLHSFPTRRSSDLCDHQSGFHFIAHFLSPPYRACSLLSACRCDAAGAALSPRSSDFTEDFLPPAFSRSEEHTSELQSRFDLVCRLLLPNTNSGNTF